MLEPPLQPPAGHVKLATLNSAAFQALQRSMSLVHKEFEAPNLHLVDSVVLQFVASTLHVEIDMTKIIKDPALSLDIELDSDLLRQLAALKGKDVEIIRAPSGHVCFRNSQYTCWFRSHGAGGPSKEVSRTLGNHVVGVEIADVKYGNIRRFLGKSPLSRLLVYGDQLEQIQTVVGNTHTFNAGAEADLQGRTPDRVLCSKHFGKGMKAEDATIKLAFADGRYWLVSSSSLGLEITITTCERLT